MIDPERIQRLAAKLGNRSDALEFVRQMRCGGRKFDGGGEKNPYNGEIRQGKKWNMLDHYFADHPMLGHRLRKAKTLLFDAARVHPYTSFATDVYDSYVGPQDESDKITTPLGVVGRGADIILNTMGQAGEIEPNMKKVFGRSFLGRIISAPDFIDDSLKFIRDFSEPVTRYDGGGRYFRTNLQDESPMSYEPMMPVYPDVSVPERYYPQPNYGNYEYPASTGMIQSMPIRVNIPVAEPGYGVTAPVEVPVLDPMKDAARRIMAVENSKANANGGWDAKTGRWYPHRSHEGGADTIAYGIKLSNGTPEAALALRQGYLTDEQAVSAVDTLVQKYYDAAKRVYDGKYGAGEWDKLSDKSQSILVDYSYNPGLAKFPKLMEGFHSGNMDLIRQNYKRYVNGKELGRNKVLLEELDTLGNEYPIFRANGGGIHINPKNKGKFTALLKRTGKSASWFKEHGTPLQRKRATFALNARKWRHDDGGFINQYDGETEETGWMRRFLSTPTMVPNMTGTATAAATSLRDIPLADSTVGTELGVGMASLWPMFGSVGSNVIQDINWLRNPANQILAKKLAGTLAVPLLGGSAVEGGVKHYTPYKGVGDFMYNAPVIPGTNWSPAEYDRRHGAPAWQQRLTQEALGFAANPGYYTPTGLLANMTDRVAQRYAEDFATHVADPVKRNWEWMKDWYDFVGRGNTSKFSEPLKFIDALASREEALAKELGKLQTALNDYPKFKLSVWPAKSQVSAPSGSIHGMPTAGTYDIPVPGTPVINTVDTPFVLENIGTPSSMEVNYLSRTAGEGVPFEFTYFPHQGSWSKKYADAAIGKPNRFNSRVSDMTFNTPESVLDVPEPIGSAFIRAGHSVSPLDQYRVTGAGGKFLPVSRKSAEQAEMYTKVVNDIDSKLAGRGTTMGSLRLYKDGMLSGSAHDTEMIVPWEYLDDVKRDFKFIERGGDNGFAINGDSPLVPQLGKQGGKGNLEIQPIRVNSRGEASGDVAWGMFKTMYPERFSAEAEKYFTTNIPYTEFGITNPNTGRPYTSLELYQEFVDGGYQTQHVVNEALGLNKRYFQGYGVPTTSEGAATLVKQNRPMSILTNPDPEVKGMVRKALDTNAYAAVGPNYKHGSEFFPNIDFADVEANKEFLKTIGIGDEKIASDPEMMRNLFDAWFMPRTTRVRFVGGVRGKAQTENALFGGNIPWNGGNVAGSGNNSVRGSYSENPIGNQQGGAWQLFPTYAESMPEVKSLKDIERIFARTEKDYIFTAEEEKIVNKILQDELKDISTFPHTDAITRRAASDLLSEVRKTPVKGINRLDQLFQKDKSPIGKMERDIAQDLIYEVSKAVDIPEIGTAGYNKFYQGVWRNDMPNARSLRFVDARMDRQPFEVGRDMWRYPNDLSKSSAGAFDPSVLSPEDRAVYNIFSADRSFAYPEGSALRAAGAEEIRPEMEVSELRKKLKQIQDISEMSEPIYGLLRRYKNMPFSSKTVRAAEKETGLHYRRKRPGYYSEAVRATEPRINGTPERIIREKISKTMPDGLSLKDIAEVKWNDKYMRYDVVTLDGRNWEVVNRDGSKWEWMDGDLPFALGGHLNRLYSVYGDDVNSIRQAIQNAKAKQKK